MLQVWFVLSLFCHQTKTRRESCLSKRFLWSVEKLLCWLQRLLENRTTENPEGEVKRNMIEFNNNSLMSSVCDNSFRYAGINRVAKGSSQSHKKCTASPHQIALVVWPNEWNWYWSALWIPEPGSARGIVLVSISHQFIHIKLPILLFLHVIVLKHILYKWIVTREPIGWFCTSSEFIAARTSCLRPASFMYPGQCCNIVSCWLQGERGTTEGETDEGGEKGKCKHNPDKGKERAGMSLLV